MEARLEILRELPAVLVALFLMLLSGAAAEDRQIRAMTLYEEGLRHFHAGCLTQGETALCAGLALVEDEETELSGKLLGALGMTHAATGRVYAAEGEIRRAG